MHIFINESEMAILGGLFHLDKKWGGVLNQ